MDDIIECESCHEMSDYHMSPNGEILCLTCGEHMLREKSEISTGGSTELAEPIAEKNILTTIVINAPETLPPLSLDEMSKNVEKAKKAFETLESRLTKMRIQKAEAVVLGNDAKVIELAQIDTELSKQLDVSYQKWQSCKKNYESAISDKENQIVAEDLLLEYSKKTDSRAVKGNEMLNSLQQLNDLVCRTSSLGSEFMQTQIVGMNDSERLIRELKRLNVYRVGGVEIPIVKADNFGSIKTIKESLQRETGLLKNNLEIIESVILKIRKACNFNLLMQD